MAEAHDVSDALVTYGRHLLYLEAEQRAERERLAAQSLFGAILGQAAVPPYVRRARDHAAKMARKREARRHPAEVDPALMNGARIDGLGRPFGGR